MKTKGSTGREDDGNGNGDRNSDGDGVRNRETEIWKLGRELEDMSLNWEKKDVSVK